jgi:hypothetical protein
MNCENDPGFAGSGGSLLAPSDAGSNHQRHWVLRGRRTRLGYHQALFDRSRLSFWTLRGRATRPQECRNTSAGRILSTTRTDRIQSCGLAAIELGVWRL